MSLPIQSTPIYTIKIPSSKESFKYRPFLVKEQKALLIAQQSEDPMVMVDTLKQVVQACSQSKIDVDKLAVFDLEYIFSQIRAKSVGEIVDLFFYCDVCDTEKAKSKVSIDITKLQVQFFPEHESKISLFGVWAPTITGRAANCPGAQRYKVYHTVLHELAPT